MVEVFKTNIEDQIDAVILLNQIHEEFAGYEANFDLEDCDKILRMCTAEPFVESARVIKLITKMGFSAGILPDEKPSIVQIMLFDRKFYPVLE